jgi:hypothetical protein
MGEPAFELYFGGRFGLVICEQETLRHPLVAVRFGQGNVTQLGGDFVMGPG